MMIDSSMRIPHEISVLKNNIVDLSLYYDSSKTRIFFHGFFSYYHGWWKMYTMLNK